MAAPTLTVTKFGDTTVYLNLWAGANLHGLGDAWTTTARGDGTWQETFTLVGVGTKTAIIAAVKLVEDARDITRRYWADTAETDYMILRYHAYSEADERHAAIISIEIEPMTYRGMHPMLDRAAAVYTCTIVRTAWRSASVTVSATDQGALGQASLRLTLDDENLPGHLYELSINPANSSEEFDNFWIGVQPDYASQAYYNTIIECESGTLGVGSAKITDAAASPDSAADNTVEYGPVSTTGTGTTTMGLPSAAGIPTPNLRGRWLVLLRQRVDSVPAATQLVYSIGWGAGEIVYNASQTVTPSTTYAFVELGEIVVPPTAGEQAAFSIVVYVSDNTAVGGYHALLDCIKLIPSERIAIARNASVNIGAGVDLSSLVVSAPDRARMRRIYRDDTYSGVGVPPSLQYKVDGAISPVWDVPSQGAHVIYAIDSPVTRIVDITVKYNRQFGIFSDETS